MKSVLRFMAALACAASLGAQEKVIRLYEGPAPGSEGWTYSEKEQPENVWRTPIVYNVSVPTLTYFPADQEKANGTAVIIAPGGGFHILAIESEGRDVARWLNQKGVACFVLKYRLAESKTEDPVGELLGKLQRLDQEVGPIVKLAMADGLQAVKHVRKNAKGYGIKPDRIGFMGFSAGGTVTAAVGMNYREESRPNFIAPIYLAYHWVPKESGVPADAPPIFIAAATDDQMGLASHSVELYTDWLKARKPAELHMYAKGGHGFGMRKQNLPTDRWIERFGEWLGVEGFLAR